MRASSAAARSTLAAFADAVFAIAITLLVLEIERPDGEQLASPAALWHFLGQQLGSFIAFVLAFFLVWGSCADTTR
jgi:uncharacterized membrane protein